MEVSAQQPRVVAHLKDRPITQAELDAMSQWITDRNLRDLRFPDPVWVVPGLLREGLAFLVSAPKLGKSWLALQLAYAVAAGGDWIGKALGDPAPVLNIMGEDSLDTLQERCLHLLPRGLDDDNLPLAHATEWPGESFVERFAHLYDLLHKAMAEGRPYKLVVIDTLEIFRGPKSDDKNTEYRGDVSILKLLRSLAMETHCAILFLHHTNKIKTAWDDGGDPFEAINGSNGIAGTANTIMMIQRARGEPTGVLHVGGHRVKDQRITLRYDYAAGCWSLDPAGDPDAAVLSGAPRAIFEYLRDNGASTLERLVVDLGRSHKKEALKKALTRMQTEGKVFNVYGLWDLVVRSARQRGSAEAAGQPAVDVVRDPGVQPPAEPAPAAVQGTAAAAGQSAGAPGSGGSPAQGAPGGSQSARGVDRGTDGLLALDVSDLDLKKAIPASMALLKSAIQRQGARYHPSLFAAQPDEIEQVWEGRHKWDGLDALPAGVLVTRLDKNAAYLSAANTALPIGRLQLDEIPERANAGRAGIHLIDYRPGIPYPCGSPLGNREEYGEIWITTPTLKLLDQVHTLLKVTPVEVLRSFTGEATEVLLRPWIASLRDLRARALAEHDETLYAFVKSCYSKTIATMGESNKNWEVRRPDWMRIIRAQAYCNLYRAMLKMPKILVDEKWISSVVHLGNVDEMWVAGNLSSAVDLGNGLGQWKIKKEWRTGEDV